MTAYPGVLFILRADHPDAESEYRFHPTRQWRFDFAIPSARVAVEIQGGIWTRGRHTRGSGLIREYEKVNAAAIRGWRIIYVTPDQLASVRSLVWAAVHHRDEEHKPTDYYRRKSRALEPKT